MVQMESEFKEILAEKLRERDLQAQEQLKVCSGLIPMTVSLVASISDTTTLSILE